MIWFTILLVFVIAWLVLVLRTKEKKLARFEREYRKMFNDLMELQCGEHLDASVIEQHKNEWKQIQKEKHETVVDRWFKDSKELETKLTKQVQLYEKAVSKETV